MMGYDTPEPQTNVCGRALEVSLANRASEQLVQLLNQGKDRYDRTLAIISVAGEDVGDLLVREGLARYWPEFWCD